LCVTAQLAKKVGGGQGKVVYIDTENTFRPERIKEISKRFDLDGDKVLENILVANAYSSDMLSELLNQAAALMLEDPFALLIIDSLMAPF